MRLKVLKSSVTKGAPKCSTIAKVHKWEPTVYTNLYQVPKQCPFTLDN